MSIIATALKHLIAAGVTGDDLVRAVAEMEAAAPTPVDRVAEKRRAYDRERKRLAKANSTGIPPESAETAETPALSRPPNENISNPPTHTHPDITPRARKAGIFPMLDCTDAETWADFLTNRAKKRLPNTASAHRKLETDLAAMAVRTGWPPGEVFAACVAKGWGAIYDPRDEDDGRRSKTIRTTHPATNGQRDGFSRALDQAIHNERTDGLACPPRQSDDASIARLLSFTPAARASG